VLLERMDALFGEIDYVEAREAEASDETIKATAYNTARAGPETEEKTVMEHVDVVKKDKKSCEKSV
jgi:hypothetical protein